MSYRPILLQLGFTQLTVNLLHVEQKATVLGNQSPVAAHLSAQGLVPVDHERVIHEVTARVASVEEEKEIPTVCGNLVEVVDALSMEFDFVLRGTAGPVTVDVGIVSHIDARELRGPTPPRLAANVARNVVLTYVSVEARRRRHARDSVISP